MLRPTRRRPLLPVLLALFALVAASCGTELTDEERAAYLSTGQATATPASGGGDLAGDGGGGTGTDLAATTGGDAGAGTTGGTGGSAAPAGGTAGTGGTTGGGSGGPAACAAPSTAVGVTPQSITLGGVFQLSGPVTGFAQQFLTGVRAKIAQVNASGGVCGRKVEYLSRDDGFDAARHASQTRDLIPKVLAIAGSFSTVDNGGAAALAGTDVPDVSIAGTPERSNLPNNISHSVFPKKPGKASPVYQYFAAQGARKVALVYVSLASARNLMDVTQETMQASGLQVVKRIELSPTQFSYDATAREIANSGADLMLFLHEINAASAMAQALANTPSSLKYPVYSAFSYGGKFTQLAGSAAEGALVTLPFRPYEEAGSNPPTQELMRWIQTVDPGATPTFDAANGWTATGLIIQALGAIPGPITRASLMTALKSVKDYDGGGVWSMTHPSTRSGGGTVIMQVKNGKWVRLAPASGFLDGSA